MEFGYLFYNANLKLTFIMNHYFDYICAELERDSNIGSTPVNFKFATLACPVLGWAFCLPLMGSYRLLTLLFRSWIKRTPPKFQYLRQASVSDDLPVSTNDLPTAQNFLSNNAFGDMQGMESLGFKKGQSVFYSN